MKLGKGRKVKYGNEMVEIEQLQVVIREVCGKCEIVDMFFEWYFVGVIVICCLGLLVFLQDINVIMIKFKLFEVDENGVY